jgi:hypothetical protein
MSETPPQYDVDVYQGWTDTQLVERVKSAHGAAGAGPSAELTRRFMEKSGTASGRLLFVTWVLVALTVVLLLLTGTLVYLTVRLT